MFYTMRYFDVYVLCQAANKLLHGGFERNINEFFESFFEGDEHVQFNKYSILHSYCEWVIGQNVWFEEDDEDILKLVKEAYKHRKLYLNKGTLWIDRAINHYCKVNFDFLDWIEEDSTKTVDQMTVAEIEDMRYNYLCNIWIVNSKSDRFYKVRDLLNSAGDKYPSVPCKRMLLNQ